MIKQNGTAGPQMPEKAFRIDYRCMCGNKETVNIGLPRGCKVAQIPELRCAQCPNLPVMERSAAQPVDLSPILRPVSAPPRFVS